MCEEMYYMNSPITIRNNVMYRINDIHIAVPTRYYSAEPYTNYNVYQMLTTSTIRFNHSSLFSSDIRQLLYSCTLVITEPIEAE
jgi:hypothetical protein